MVHVIFDYTVFDPKLQYLYFAPFILTGRRQKYNWQKTTRGSFVNLTVIILSVSVCYFLV